jgi:phosphatidate cytidylyltransferase
MFWTRLISGIVLIAAALVSICLGGFVLMAVLLLLSLVGMREYYKAVGLTKDKITSMEWIAYIGAVIYYLSMLQWIEAYSFLVIAAVFLAMMVLYVITFPHYQSKEVAAYFFGFFYVAVMLGFILLTQMRWMGSVEVWLIFLSSWGSDTLAYCTGSLFGRHKMTPVLSPKKSIEGAVGGVAGAALLTMIYAIVFDQDVLVYTLTVAIAAIISIFGDLAASAVKRQNNIKDYGKLIPGHGGVLDRFDSVIFTAPVIYFCCMLFLG